VFPLSSHHHFCHHGMIVLCSGQGERRDGYARVPPGKARDDTE
jgi:hypothetical protein